MTEQLLSFLVLMFINYASIFINLRYLQSERRRHQLLVKEYTTLENTLNAMAYNYEESARYIEAREREMRQKLQGRAEQLIVMRTARGRNGSFEVARLFLTETDVMFLKGRPGLWGVFAEAIKDTSERWFYQAIGGVA